jgi:hypothetical protein
VRLLALACASIGLFPPGARAQDDDLDPRMFSAVGRVAPSGRAVHRPFALALASGYGYTEGVLGSGDAHHRLAGTLAGEIEPTRWLGVGLRLDGRYDSHSLGGGSSDSGWVGDPRLFVRADRAFGGGLSAGLRASLWLPGEKAPSVNAAATTTDLLAALSYVPAGGTVALSANAGYRIDKSAASAPDAGRLMPSDRLALGVSDFDAALLGVGAAVGSRRYHVFGEWTWDVLVGGGAPPPMTSPMRVGVGGRARITSFIAFEGLAEVSPSSRPAQGNDQPLVPVPPRFVAMAGLVGHFGGGKPRATESVPEPAVTVAREEPPAQPAEPAPTATLEARIEAGGRLPPDVKVVVKTVAGEREAKPDADGRLSLGDLPAGPAEVTATAEGYEPARVETRLEPGKPVTLALELRPKLPPGQIRGTVRSFGGRGVTATVIVKATDAGAGAAGAQPAAAPVEIRAEGGAFQIDVQPGSYEVTIRAAEYETQTRSVRVEQNGVTVLNVDLRRAER